MPRLVFGSDSELSDSLEELLAESPERLAGRAREQHLRTIEEYSPEGFSRAIGEVLRR